MPGWPGTAQTGALEGQPRHARSQSEHGGSGALSHRAERRTGQGRAERARVHFARSPPRHTRGAKRRRGRVRVGPGAPRVRRSVRSAAKRAPQHHTCEPARRPKAASALLRRQEPARPFVQAMTEAVKRPSWSLGLRLAAGYRVGCLGLGTTQHRATGRGGAEGRCFIKPRPNLSAPSEVVRGGRRDFLQRRWGTRTAVEAHAKFVTRSQLARARCVRGV